MHRLLFSLGLALALQTAKFSATSAGEPSGPLSGFAQQRNWSDQSGRFKIPAELAYADRKEVRLRKADGLIVTVPLGKLSVADQQYINGFLTAETALGAASPSVDEADNPFAGGSASPAPAGRSMPNRSASGAAAPPASTVEPGSLTVREPKLSGFKPLAITPSPAFWSTKPPVPFPAVELEEQVLPTPLLKPFFASMCVMAGGKAGTVVLNAYQQDRGGKASFGNFVIATTSSGDVSQVFEFDQPWKLLALSADASRMAAVRVEGFDKGNDLAIFRIVNNRVVPEFQFTAGGGSWDELHWAAFLPGGRLATISQKHDLTFWDLNDANGPRALLRGKTGGSQQAETSAAGDLMAFPLGNSIAVIETQNGKMVGSIARDQPANRIAFSPDGKLIAAFHPFNITLYSTENGEEVRNIAIGEGNSQATIRWIGENLMVNNVLFDVTRGVPLWTYESKLGALTSLGGYLIGGSGSDKQSTLGVFRLPHNVAMRVANNVDPTQIYAINPGDSVSVRYDLSAVPSDAQQSIREAIQSKIESLGWKLADNAPNSLEITIKQGEMKEVEYYTQRGFGPGPIFAPPGFRPSGPSEKVSYRPWTHSFTLKAGADEVFTSQYVRGAPDSLQTKDGETTQATVNRIVQPNPDYFKNLAVPARVLKKQYRDGLGKSVIDGTGIH